MAPDASRPLRRATFSLLALAAFAVEIAAADTRPVAASVGLALGWVAAAAVLARLVPVPADPRAGPPRWTAILVLALAAAPFLSEPLRRAWTGDGYPLELQMVCGLRNVGLGLAACAGWLLCLRAATAASLFLVLFSAAMTNHPAVLALLGLYAAAGSAWLVLVYWSGLQAALVGSGRAVAVEVAAEPVRLPWAGLALLLLALGGGTALAVIGPKRATVALGELVPTSGGTGATDPFARYGVGDGPEEAAGDSARAAGMVETNKMIEDNRNSLIDAVSDMYGPPHKPPKERERMVAAGLADVIPFHGALPDNRRPSRDFDTSRKGPQAGARPKSQAARGLFEVEGRTPLHVRVVAYEQYDTGTHRWRDARPPNSRLIEPGADDWMRVGHLRDNRAWYGADERHRLKCAEMKDNLVPTPALLTRFRINKVDRPDYYEWDYDGVLALAGRRRTPPGVVVTTDSRTLDPARLPGSAFGGAGAGGPPAPLGEVPAALRPEVERIARAWAGDRPRGWPQIEAIVAHLRTGYAHDREAAAPREHPAPVLWFLSESRRGPDYLFATAAVLLLRALDYPARPCLGYYAGPEAYDPKTSHTPVRKTDLHFWAEVQLRDGHWLVVEPTPGYAVLEPAPPLSARVLAALRACGAWAGRNALALTTLALVAVGAALKRRQLTDAAAVRLWRWFPGRTWREQVSRVVRLLERRARWAGAPRAPGQTVAAWVRATLGDREDGTLAALTRLAERAAYEPDGPAPQDAPEVCRRALAAWPVTRWRTEPKPTAPGGPA